MIQLTCRRCGKPVPEGKALRITASGRRTDKPICPPCHEDEVVGRGTGMDRPVKNIRRRANMVEVDKDW
jgi:hypothetical protein